MSVALLRGMGSPGVAFGRIEVDGFREKVQIEFLPAIFSQHADRVRPALPAMPHQLGAAFAGVLDGLEFLRRRSPLPVQSVKRAMRRIGNQRHDVMQEGAARLDLSIDLDQMLVVHARNQDGIDFHQHLARGQHFEPEHLPFVQNPRSLDTVAGLCR